MEAEPSVRAEQHEALVSGGYLLGQRPHLLDGQWHDLLPWYRRQLRLGARIGIFRSRTAARKTALTVLKTVREVLAAGPCVVVRLVTQPCTSPRLMALSARFSQKRDLARPASRRRGTSMEDSTSPTPTNASAAAWSAVAVPGAGIPWDCDAERSRILRGLLGAGHQRDLPVWRISGPEHKPTPFPTFATAAIAGIGDLPDTITDRSVVLRIQKRKLGEKVAPFRSRYAAMWPTARLRLR